MRGKRVHSNWRDIDWVTIAMVLVLALFGWMNIYGAGYNFEQTGMFDFANRAGKQFVWIMGAGLLASIICLISQHVYKVLAYVMYGAMMLLLLVTPVLASDVKGSLSWINLGPLSLQPAEFMKWVAALAVAKYMSSYGYRVRDWRDMLVPFALMLVPMAVIAVLQRETGSALVLVSLLLPFYREGMSGYVLVAGVVAAICFVLALRVGIWPCVLLAALLVGYYVRRNRARLIQPGSFLHHWRTWAMLLMTFVSTIVFSLSCNLVFNRVLQPHQRVRIEVLLGMRDDPSGAGYNVAQSHIAIGSGWWLGKGYLQGTQTKLKFVPEQDTDFIFCTVGEEWGFVGSTAVLLLYLAFILRLITIAERQRDAFARIYGYGVAAVFLFHLTINVGMVLGLMPVIGIPLPFFSYGGSSLWSFTIMLFILLRLDASRTEQMH